LIWIREFRLRHASDFINAENRTQNAPLNDTPESRITLEGAVEQAKRAFALKRFEEAVEHYAAALELM
jgi:hypothetical protein